jgi:hypothetical protein
VKDPERIEDYLEHIAEAIDRITAYIQDVTTILTSTPMSFGAQPRTTCPRLKQQVDALLKR